MIDERDQTDLIETERYELFEGPSYKFHFDRRNFIKAFGVGIVFIVPLGRAIAQQRGQGESGRGGGDERQPSDIGAWIHIDEDGGVRVFTGKVEMGQNIRTSLAQAVADELHVPVGTIRMVMGDTDLTPFDRGTFGSLSTPTMAPQLRKAAAAAREALIEMAAQQLSVEPASVKPFRRIGRLQARRSRRLTRAISFLESTNTLPTSNAKGCFSARLCAPRVSMRR